MIDVYNNKTFDEERALYGVDGIEVNDCVFDGPADGESALKEGRDIRVLNSFFNLRYPFWHDDKLVIEDSEMTDKCRAALWYSKDICIKNTRMNGIKALRECDNVMVEGCQIVSPEFGWSVRDIEMIDTDLAFEKSQVEATITTPMISIKNPLSGKIEVPSVEELIIDDESSKAEILFV